MSRRLVMILSTSALLICILCLTQMSLHAEPTSTQAPLSYCIVDTGQIRSYNASTEIQYPKTSAAFFGQDAQYNGNQPAYKDNGDATVTDLNTALMWHKYPGSKKTYAQAVADAAKCTTGGYSDWRLPTIKELYSLILFSGADPAPAETVSEYEGL